MLTELPESAATGEIARIFGEIRHVYATPYVSSIHRHLATLPGVLEWAWEASAPVFRSGRAQETAWRIAADVSLAAPRRIPAEALAVWRVAPDDVPRIRAIADSFTRVAPLNLVFGGIVRDLLRGAKSVGSGTCDAASWTPPPALASPPAMVDPARLSEAERRLLELFRSGSGATAFVPGLYRMLAHWPALLAHLAVDLVPLLSSPEKLRIAETLLASIDAAVADLRAGLPLPKLPAPDPDTAAHLRRMIDGYRVTSPEMILFGRLVREALPV
ncbi:MAG: hypothetical protein AB7O57_11700 [Hyphomicrobiaceae bacterium]